MRARERTLRLAGRRFGPFERAIARQAAAFEAAEATLEATVGGSPTRASGSATASAARLAGGSAGVRLDAAWVGLPELEHRLLRTDALRDGTVDLALVPTDWLPELIDREQVVPLGDALPDDWERAWSPSLRELQTDANGDVYGIAYHDGPTMLLYRRDLLERAGIEPPTDWDGFKQVAQRFTDAAAGRYGAVFAGASDGHNDVYDFVAQLVAHDGTLLDADGAPAFASAAGEAALRRLHAFWHVNRVVDPAARAWDSVASGERFAAGHGAVTVNWAGFAALSGDPASPTHGLVACAPPPGRALNVYWVVVVAAGAHDRALARAFARHLATPAMDRVTAQEGATATRRDSWRDPEIQALAPYYAALEAAHDGAVTMPRTPRLPALCAVLSDLVAEVVWHGREPSAALDAAAQRAAQALQASPTDHQGAASR
jgi:multiple sugar transport system substrate-binding protein